MTELQPDDDQLRTLRLEAYQLLLSQARSAAEKRDLTRFDQVMDRLAPGSDFPSRGDHLLAVETRIGRRMNLWRISMAALLVLGLIAIVVYAIGSNSESAAQYVPLVSGLGGIAIGWLYSGVTGPQHLSS